MESNLRVKKVTRIRNRASYKLFEQLYDFLASKPSITDILQKVFDVLDTKRGFGSQQNSDFAAESLDWVLKDRGR